MDLCFSFELASDRRCTAGSAWSFHSLEINGISRRLMEDRGVLTCWPSDDDDRTVLDLLDDLITILIDGEIFSVIVWEIHEIHIDSCS
jgi:hypothetical protein